MSDGGSAYVRALATSLSDSNKELSETYGRFASLYDRKLWHQLSDGLEVLVKGAPSSISFEALAELYQEFVASFADKLNQIKVVELASLISRGLADTKVGFEFLKLALDKPHVKADEEANAFAACELAVFHLEFDEEASAKNAIANARLLVNGRSQLSRPVYSSFYRLVAKYHKVNGPPEAFYKNAMYYLAYTPLELLSQDAQSALAFDLSLSALVGENVFSFGELIGHEIFGTLEASGKKWLGDLLRAFNAGDIDKYDEIVSANGEKLAAQPVLVRYKTLLKQKISVLALMELVMSRENRTIDFQTIAETSKLPLEEVEILVMKALSKNLVRGSIDEIDQTVTFTWVQPRALTVDQIAQMKDRLGEWSGTVNNTLDFLNDQTAEMFK
mmetsp:Transcript_1903/g.5944  ORF Transcript_1903/g.5944 Transcript_1903/m.5944 type:complete len:388 (+) Transcript_1903:86-1249(+)